MAEKNMREGILNAVNKVVARNGLGGTTIEAVAREAGVSKGGVLYHFPTRLDMLLAMIDRYEEGFLEARSRLVSTMPPHPLNLLRATVAVMLKDMNTTREEIPNYATVLDDERLRNRVGDFKRKTFDEMKGILKRPALAALVFYVIDGLWMNARFNPAAIDSGLKDAAIDELQALVDSLESV